MFSRVVGAVVLFFALVLLYEPGAAEWYVGVYGGFSSPSDLPSVSMPDFGRRSVLDDPLLGNGAGNPALASVTQTFKTSDLKTSTSPIFGGKVGYFFDQQQFPWLGVELEVFTTKPDIEGQVVQTNQDIQFNPVNIAPTGSCTDFYPTATPNCPQLITKTGSLQIPASSLRVFTAAANVLVRYPGRWIEPYAGVGIGAFYFRGTGPITGDQVVPGFNGLWGVKLFPFEDWGVFVEGKYNRATITSLDSTFGISGTYDVFHVVVGALYRF